MQQAVFFNQVLAPLIDAESWRTAIGAGTASVPATAASAGVAGTIAYDASYVYVCIAADTWKRVPITTW